MMEIILIRPTHFLLWVYIEVFYNDTDMRTKRKSGKNTRANLWRFFIVCIYIYTKMYCCLRSSYQEGSLSQARTWISNVICHGLFCVQWVQLRWEAIVDNGGIDDYHCLNFLCTTESMFLFILKVVPIRYFQLFLSVGLSVIIFFPCSFVFKNQSWI